MPMPLPFPQQQHSRIRIQIQLPHPLLVVAQPQLLLEELPHPQPLAVKSLMSVASKVGFYGLYYASDMSVFPLKGNADSNFFQMSGMPAPAQVRILFIMIRKKAKIYHGPCKETDSCRRTGDLSL